MVPKTRELADELTQRARKQLWASAEFKKPRMTKINKSIDLLLGNTEKKLRQQFNIPLPVLSGMYERLAADLDDPVQIKFKEQTPKDYFAVQKINAAWKVESQSARTAARWAYKDRISRKQALIYGRGILKYFSEGSPYKSYLEATDFTYFHFQPTKS